MTADERQRLRELHSKCADELPMHYQPTGLEPLRVEARGELCVAAVNALSELLDQIDQLEAAIVGAAEHSYKMLQKQDARIVELESEVARLKDFDESIFEGE